MAETKPIRYRAVVGLSFDDGSRCEPGDLLNKKQAGRVEDEDAWLLDQGKVVKDGDN